MAFTADMFCRFTIHYKSFLLKEHVPKIQGSYAWKMTVRSIMENVHESFLTV